MQGTGCRTGGDFKSLNLISFIPDELKKPWYSFIELPWHWAVVKHLSQGRYVMKVSKAGKVWLDYHRIHSKKKHG
jgi:hypothetical protein